MSEHDYEAEALELSKFCDRSNNWGRDVQRILASLLEAHARGRSEREAEMAAEVGRLRTRCSLQRRELRRLNSKIRWLGYAARADVKEGDRSRESWAWLYRKMKESEARRDRDAEQTREFLAALGAGGSCIVPTSACTADEVTYARAEGRLLVTSDGLGYVRRTNTTPAVESAAEECAYCGERAEGNYSIHRDGFGEGPEVPLCDGCGGNELPSCPEIWSRISQSALAAPATEEE